MGIYLQYGGGQKMSALKELKQHLRQGQVYRRSDLQQWSNAIDRHLSQLVREEVLQKLAPGLYYYPKQASFGAVPPEEKKLVSAFLKSDDFLLTSPNLYNSLRVGTTQLYNKRIVYNHKRHGQFTLGGKVFDFRLKHKFPPQLSEQFLLVDLVNNVNELAEDRESVLEKVKEKFFEEDDPAMTRAINAYAGERTKALFNQWKVERETVHV